MEGLDRGTRAQERGKGGFGGMQGNGVGHEMAGSGAGLGLVWWGGNWVLGAGGKGGCAVVGSMTVIGWMFAMCVHRGVLCC